MRREEIAAANLAALETKDSVSDNETESKQWWESLTREQQVAYLHLHKHSKFHKYSLKTEEPSSGSGEDVSDEKTNEKDLAEFTAKPPTKAHVDCWNRIIKRKPNELLASLFKGLPSNFVKKFEVEPVSNDVTMTIKGKTIEDDTEIIRHFFHDEDGKLCASHEVFCLNDADQGKDFAKKFMRNSMQEYRRMGVSSVFLTANLDVGAYAWAKYGFLPKKNDWNQLRDSRYLGMFSMDKRLSLVKGQLSESEYKHVQSLLENKDPRTIFQVSDLTIQIDLAKVRKPQILPDHRHYANAFGHRKGSISLGKFLLLAQEWEGHFDLSDSECNNRFHTYIESGGKNE